MRRIAGVDARGPEGEASLGRETGLAPLSRGLPPPAHHLAQLLLHAGVPRVPRLHQFAHYPALAQWAPPGAAPGVCWFGALGFFGVAVAQWHTTAAAKALTSSALLRAAGAVAGCAGAIARFAGTRVRWPVRRA
jgi:hypothetical protein